MTDKSKEIIQKELFEKGLIRLNKRKFKLAINFFSKLIKLSPANKDYVLCARGKAKFLLQNYKGAFDDYSEAIINNPENINALLERGKTKFFQDEYRDAINDFSKVIEKNLNSNALFYRGKSNFFLNNYTSALNDFSKLIEIVPDYIDLNNKEDLFDMEAQLIPEDSPRIFSLRETVFELKKNIKLLKINAKNETQFLERGNAKSYFKQYQGAFDDYSKAITLNPFNKDAYLNRSNVGIKLKKFDQSKKDFLNASKIVQKKTNKESDNNKKILLDRQKEYFQLLREKGSNEKNWNYLSSIKEFLMGVLIFSAFIFAFVLGSFQFLPTYLFLIFLVLLILIGFISRI